VKCGEKLSPLIFFEAQTISVKYREGKRHDIPSDHLGPGKMHPRTLDMSLDPMHFVSNPIHVVSNPIHVVSDTVTSGICVLNADTAISGRITVTGLMRLPHGTTSRKRQSVPAKSPKGPQGCWVLCGTQIAKAALRSGRPPSGYK
jgi:hypothetical protein